MVFIEGLKRERTLCIIVGIADQNIAWLHRSMTLIRKKRCPRPLSMVKCLDSIDCGIQDSHGDQIIFLLSIPTKHRVLEIKNGNF